MRLRPLSEIECYARCHGWGESLRLAHVDPVPAAAPAGLSREDLRQLCESWIEGAEAEAQAA